MCVCVCRRVSVAIAIVKRLVLPFYVEGGRCTNFLYHYLFIIIIIIIIVVVAAATAAAVVLRKISLQNLYMFLS